MKTIHSAFNRFLVASLLILLTLFALTNLPFLEPQREKLSTFTGIPLDYIWVPVCIAAAILLGIGVYRTRAQVAAPISKLSEECRMGQPITRAENSLQTKEVRLIRDFIQKSQERTQHRSEQLREVEQELKNLRREQLRSTRKIEELEDLVAAYARIRSELTIDNNALKRENSQLASELAHAKKPNNVAQFPLSNRA